MNQVLTEWNFCHWLVVVLADGVRDRALTLLRPAFHHFRLCFFAHADGALAPDLIWLPLVRSVSDGAHYACGHNTIMTLPVGPPTTPMPGIFTGSNLLAASLSVTASRAGRCYMEAGCERFFHKHVARQGGRE